MRDLDSVIHSMYASISYEPGGKPDWKLNDELFAPHARVVRVNDDGVFEFDIESFRADFDRMKMPSFWEGEIWRETRQFGEVAQVLSAYEMRQTRDGAPFSRGVNSIQLYRKNGDWIISAMIWRREGKDVKIPAKP